MMNKSQSFFYIHFIILPYFRPIHLFIPHIFAVKCTITQKTLTETYIWRSQVDILRNNNDILQTYISIYTKEIVLLKGHKTSKHISIYIYIHICVSADVCQVIVVVLCCIQHIYTFANLDWIISAHEENMSTLLSTMLKLPWL